MSGVRIAVALVAYLLVGHLVWAAEPIAPPAAAPTAALTVPPFGRVFLPAAEIESRTWRGGYLPIEAAQFEQLLQTIAAAAADAPGARAAQLEKAEYTLRLEGDDQLVGNAQWQLVRRGQAPSLLELDPCTLALHSGAWADLKSRPAVIGSGADGRARVAVEGSQLVVACSLRGERTASGAVNFRLELPGTPIARLSLDAPAGIEVTADQGIVSKTAGPDKANRWTIDLGGHNRVDVRVVSEQALRERRPLTLLRQAVEYEFSARGVNVVAQLKVDVHGEPLRKIALDLDPSLRLVTARYGDQDVPWSAVLDVETHVSHVLLQLPEAIVGTDRVLQLSAMAPLVTDKAWRLPGLQAEGMSWQEGTATLLIPHAFVLQRLVTDGCRQSRITELPTPLLGESIQVQYYRPGASIEVLLTQRREPLKVDSGTQVELTATEISSRCSAQISSTGGERHVIEIQANPGWTIDAIENLETNRSVDWEPDDQPTESTGVEVRLDSPITASHPARLLFRGHRRVPTEAAFEAGQLEMLDFDSFQSGIRLIGVRAAEGSELRWADALDLKARDALELSAVESQLFPSQPNGPLFVEDQKFSRAIAGLERRRPSYTTVIRIDAAVQKQTLTETFTIQCTPEAARVERLLVRFSHARELPLEWNLAGGNSGQFSARKLSAGEQAQAGLSAGGEAWEVNLRLARPGPFELRAVRTVTLEGETPLVLASVADATSQRGTLAIRSLGASGLSITNRRLTSVPAELLEADRYQTARATYHYQPARDDLGADAAVSIAPARPTQSESGAWAWSSRLVSRYAVDGTCVHFATFRIQTAGRQQVRVLLPATATLQSASVDHQRITKQFDGAPGEALTIDLPSGRSFATVSLYYATSASLPGLVSGEQPPFPTLDDVPVMNRQWTVWLPPGYEIADTSDPLAVRPAAPGTWSQRLFGALGRGAGRGFFNPLRESDWSATFTRSESLAAHTIAEQFASTLAASASDHFSGEEPTWGHLLSLAGEAESRSRRTLLVDAPALEGSGLTPQTHVRVPLASTDLAKGLELLRQNHLELLAGQGVLLLTTDASAAAYATQLIDPAAELIHAISPGALTEALLAAKEHQQGSRFETIETWRATPNREQSPWLGFEGAVSGEIPGRGWSTYSILLSDTSEPTVHIVRTAAMSSLAWAVFLTILAVALWPSRRRPAAILGLLAIAAAMALVLPTAYGPLASAALMASTFCLAILLIGVARPNVAPVDRSHSSFRRSAASHPVATLLFAAALANLAQGLRAAPADENSAAPTPSPTRPAAAGEKLPAAPLPAGALPVAPADETAPIAAARPDRPGVYQVYVPLDASQTPTGGKYFVPEQLYAQLARQASQASGQPKGWLLTRAVYEGTVSRDPVHRRPGLSQLKASFDLRVFQANVRVGIPLDRETLAAARLEGRAIPLVWNAAGDELVVGPLDAERYRLELDLRPTQRADATTAGFDVAIPALTSAVLELTIPPDAPAIEVATARGEVHLQKERGKLRAQLGNANRLDVRWPIGGGGVESVAPTLEVEELMWVKVRPGTTVVDARFKYRVLEGRVSQLRLLTDPRLRLLPETTPQSVIAAVHTIPGDPQKIDLELSHPVSDHLEVDLSFLVTGTSGVGNLRLPRLESSGARAVRRWLGVSVDPALQSRVQAGEDSKQLDVPEFAAAWGPSEGKPLAAFGVPRGEPMWGLSTQPNEPHASVEQTLVLSLGRSSTRAQFDAVVAITGGYLFQLGLQIPRGLVIDQVAMLEDDVQRVARWSTDADGQTTVFFTAPVNGRQRMTVRGRWEPTVADSFVVPIIRLLGAETKKNFLQLYRQSAVLANVELAPGTSQVEPGELVSPEGFGALLGCYSLDTPSAGATVRLSPNAERARAVAVTSLQRDGQRWVAELEYHVNVTEGLADTLEFEVPAQWSEPYQIEPALPLKVVPIPGEIRRRMVVTPPEPIQGPFQFKVRGRVALSAGDRLRVPDILPLHVQQADRFVVLPSHLDLQQVVWDTMGLSRATLPADFLARGRNAQSQTVYQVAGDHFQATLNAVKRAGLASRVVLADIHVTWQGDGKCQGVATFDLEQGTAGSCVLELPTGYQLVHAAVESLPALLLPIDATHWRLNLGPQQLPQRVQVIYTGTLVGSATQRVFQAPRLVDLKVGQTLWAIHSPSQLGVPRSNRPEFVSLTAPEYTLAQLENLSSLVQLPAEIVGEHLPEEMVRWYQPWKQRYEASRATLDWQLTTVAAARLSSDPMSEARKLDQQIATAYSRLGLPAAETRRGDLIDASTELVIAGRGSLSPAYYTTPSESPSIPLSYAAPPDGRALRWLTALAIVLGGAVGVVVVQRRSFPVLPAVWVIGAAGLAWWLFLTPSIVGLVVFLGACAAGLHSRWLGTARAPTA